MIDGAGLWHRGVAALVDIALALVRSFAAVGFQLTGGRVATGFNLSKVCSSTTAETVDMPRGDAVPADFAPDHAALCRSTFFGATTGLSYVLSRTETHAGLDVTTSRAFPVDLAWHAAGGRVDLDPFPFQMRPVLKRHNLLPSPPGRRRRQPLSGAIRPDADRSTATCG